MDAGARGRQQALHSGQFACEVDSTPQGVRHARQWVARRLADWGCGPDSEVSGDAALVVGELAANATAHGCVDDSRFRVRVAMLPDAGAPRVLRIDVTDAREDRLPQPGAARPDGESGRGLWIVGRLAERWGYTVHPPRGKTVWVEIVLPGVR